MLKAKNTLVLIVLLSLLGLAAFFFYPNDKSATHPWQPENLQSQKFWYQINWQNQAVGWASLSLEKNRDHFAVTEEDFITGRVQSQRMEFSFKRELVFSSKSPYQLSQITITSKEPYLSVEKQINNGKQLSAIETRNGKATELLAPTINYTLEDYLTKYSWLQRKNTKPTQIVKEFNNDDYGLHYSRYELMGTAPNSNNVYRVKHQLQNSADINDSYQSQASLLEFSQEGYLLKETKANGMIYIKSDGKVTINPEMQRDLYLASGIAVDQALGKTQQIKGLELLITPALKLSNAHPALNIENNRLRLKRGYEYPGQRSTIEAAHPRAGALAQSLIKSSQTINEKVESLVSHVHNRLTYKTLPASFEIDDILDNGIGDCTEHALLLTEMLNAIDIPARQVSGLIYLGDEKQRFGGHVWVEFFNDGYWQAIDPTWNLTNVSATHIPLMLGANKTPELLLKATEIEFKVIDVQR
ncbi:transglutaminase family protein [Kangiella sp. HZ709]|uniref:transglutaminase-like domain-containing protein n=1 Tax=Kangiella sp. HZ709 TaxID=2666328 RepID=UPI0012B126FA|nr:transglutaminase-like domain-containing protein [Kangiella sp. HZ709]MRX26802.1 transglutaminase domain-containing protein [Kangiella sp. HZ709]